MKKIKRLAHEKDQHLIISIKYLVQELILIAIENSTIDWALNLKQRSIFRSLSYPTIKNFIMDL